MILGQVHLGVGAFHRAHQAWYTQQALDKFGGDWGICGISLRRPDVRDALAASNNSYTLAVKNGAETQLHTIHAIGEILVAPEAPATVIARLAAPTTHVVTLTITEKGYCLQPASGELDEAHVDIVHDLASPEVPRSAIGFLVAGLALRRQQAGTGLTLLSCDNLADNGNKLKAALLQFALRLDQSLAQWINHQCSFPCSMVDRIVPANDDLSVVVTEPFCQWVIEENFAGPVPPWDAVGAQYVAAVAPFERMKLRLLNAAHSNMAYLGWLAGYQTIADVLEDEHFKDLIRQLMNQEMAPTLHGLGDFDVAGYQQQLMDRFANRGLEHRLQQIAMDGSQKVPQRLLPGLQWQIRHAGNYQAIALGIAGWILYTRGIDERGGVYPVDDPLAEVFLAAAAAAGDDIGAYMSAILSLDSIFPESVANNPEFRLRLLACLQTLQQQGALATVHDQEAAGAKREMMS
jgi:fructuronate reductase